MTKIGDYGPWDIFEVGFLKYKCICVDGSGRSVGPFGGLTYEEDPLPFIYSILKAIDLNTQGALYL